MVCALIEKLRNTSWNKGTFPLYITINGELTARKAPPLTPFHVNALPYVKSMQICPWCVMKTADDPVLIVGLKIVSLSKYIEGYKRITKALDGPWNTVKMVLTEWGKYGTTLPTGCPCKTDEKTRSNQVRDAAKRLTATLKYWLCGTRQNSLPCSSYV